MNLETMPDAPTIRLGDDRRLLSWWLGIALLLSSAAGLLVLFRGRFAHEVSLDDIPALSLAAGLAVTGLIYAALLPLIRRSFEAPTNIKQRVLTIIIVTGAVLRLAMFWTTPALEDDYHRYLWDGAVTAHGFNPYAAAPEDARISGANSPLAELTREGGHVLERINHPQIKTIYPPVAQGAFALAHVIAPWSLNGWRVVCFAGELTTLFLLMALLGCAQRSPLWIALYWWNPVVIKEAMNSAHMEAVLMPLVLCCLLLSVRRRHVAAAAVLGLAAGTKLWPVLLAPLILRPLVKTPLRMIAALGVLAVLALVLVFPVYAGGLDQTSGFVMYARFWKTNSALFPAVEQMAGWLTVAAGLEIAPGHIVRAVFSVLTGAIAVWAAWRPLAGAEDLMTRAGFVVAVLFLLSPAQYPWYLLWVVPFLAFQPTAGFIAATALVPLYYASFYFHANDAYHIFRDYAVWLIWIPIWGLLAAELTSRRRANVRLPA